MLSLVAVKHQKEALKLSKLDDLWSIVGRKNFHSQLYKGECVFYEIAGFDLERNPIMSTANLKDLKDKTIKSKYEDKMVYSYGCSPDGELNGTKPLCNFYVYRIIHTTPDGHTLEMAWPQVKARCKQLGIKHVMELHEPLIYDGNLDRLTEIVESLCDGPDPIDPSHCREGVVIRVETPDGETFFLKHKGFTFRLIEGHIKEKEDIVDIEEAS